MEGRGRGWELRKTVFSNFFNTSLFPCLTLLNLEIKIHIVSERKQISTNKMIPIMVNPDAKAKHCNHGCRKCHNGSENTNIKQSRNCLPYARTWVNPWFILRGPGYSSFSFVLLFFQSLVLCFVFLCFVCLRPMSYVSNVVASVSRLSILECPVRFTLTFEE